MGFKPRTGVDPHMSVKPHMDVKPHKSIKPHKGFKPNSCQVPTDEKAGANPNIIQRWYSVSVKMGY